MESSGNELALGARWHRVDAGIQRVRRGVESGHPFECLSAVADTLDALYDLWDFWSTKASLSWKAQDTCAAGDVSGETAAALIFARGGKTHAHVALGELTDTFTDTFHDIYGCWRWQEYSDPKYAVRSEWYAARVSGQEVLPPLVAAVAWLRMKPELGQRPEGSSGEGPSNPAHR